MQTDMEAARSAITLKLRGRRRGDDDSLGAVATDLDELMRPLGRSRRRREVFLRRLVAESIHLPDDIDELEAIAFDAAAE